MSHKYWNLEKRLYVNLEGVISNAEEMSVLHPPEAIDSFFHITGVLQKLKISDEEEALLTAIAFMAAGRVEISRVISRGESKVG